MDCPDCNGAGKPVSGCFVNGNKICCCQDCGCTFESNIPITEIGIKLLIPVKEGDNGQEFLFPVVANGEEVTTIVD